MSENANVLPPEGGAVPGSPAPTLKRESVMPAGRVYAVTGRDRAFLGFTAVFCILLAHTFLWTGATAGMTASVFAWYTLVLAYWGMKCLSSRQNRILLAANLFLAATLALGSDWMFRAWNCMALLLLLPLHAVGLAGRGQLPWYRLGMLAERLLLVVRHLFGNLGAGAAALRQEKSEGGRRQALWLALGLGLGLLLVCFLLPILASADALFDAATRSLRLWAAEHLSEGLWQVILGLLLTPFFFSLLYGLAHPGPVKPAWKEWAPNAEPVVFAAVLGALDLLYLLFLGVQSAGLFGGPEYLSQRGISYAEWARSGFFQMVGVTVLNLTVLLAALSLARREGALWRVLRGLAVLLTAESLVLLASAGWRMSLYVSAYGLSFKRCMTYWGMGVMGLLFLGGLWKVVRPGFRYCRWAFPVMLAGWVLVNCVPIDFLVARDQVGRYLAGESGSVDLGYLVYGLSYDTLGPLEALDGEEIYEIGGRNLRLKTFLEERREAARAECGDWRTWSLSACLASGRSQ